MIPEQEQRLQILMQKYRNKDISYEEYLELFEYLGNPAHKEKVLAIMDEDYKTISADADVHDVDWDAVYKNITDADGGARSVRPFWKYLAAAVVVFALSFSLLNVLKKESKIETVALNREFKNDVSPAENKAVLQLSDGSQVMLNDKGDGVLANEGNTAITKTHNGEIVYHQDGQATTAYLVYNTIITPRGGRYHVILPDGSKVWLNAASSLRFPTAFSGNDRRVELKGEAYFEVAKNKTKPFFVKVGTSEIKVLGTQFNVMSYATESVAHTTLIEGSVQFTNNQHQHILVPGEQAVHHLSSGKVNVSKVNPEDYIAWKNGLFIFNNTNIKDIMKDISRWYDVDVNYADDLPDTYFTGVIPRSVNVSKVLNVLEGAGDVDFGINGKLITCSKIKPVQK